MLSINSSTWRQQLIDERDALAAKIDALKKYMSGGAFWSLPAAERALIQEQRDAMGTYVSILTQRLTLGS